MSSAVDYGLITDSSDVILDSGDLAGDNDRSFRNIRICFEAQLDQLGFDTKVFENTNIDLTTLDKGEAGIKFVRGTMLPASTDQATLGTSGRDLHTGIFQIDYFSELGIGGYTDDLDTIANAFKRGTVLSFGGTEVTCRNVSLGVGRRDDAFFIRNVDVSYFALTSARS